MQMSQLPSVDQLRFAIEKLESATILREIVDIQFPTRSSAEFSVKSTFTWLRWEN